MRDRVAEEWQPEVLLAMAVIRRGVQDATCASVKRRDLARDQIAQGGLEYWIAVLDRAMEMGGEVRARVERLVS
jgi:hypothetical protein